MIIATETNLKGKSFQFDFDSDLRVRSCLKKHPAKSKKVKRARAKKRRGGKREAWPERLKTVGADRAEEETEAVTQLRYHGGSLCRSPPLAGKLLDGCTSAGGSTSHSGVPGTRITFQRRRVGLSLFAEAPRITH